MPDTLKSLLDDAAEVLADASPAPRLDAELLLAHALGKGRSHLHAHPEETPSPAALESFRGSVAARRRGEPIAYLTSKREFWSLELKVNPATLIPRHETELLVELALRRTPAGADWDLLDLGTGSGAVALALARERPRCRVTATDMSAEALAVAASNAAALSIGNVEFVQGDWFAPLARRRFKLAVSNPPYVREHDPHLQMGDVRFEPRAALASGADGLDDLRRIVAAASVHLEPRGWLLLEHGHDQGAAVRALLAAHGYTAPDTFKDLSGRDRVSGGIRTDTPAAR
ncbi:MAG TPA: peptide chain release factor N(5)-glutamine methyltransferase [Gammaproteobacteria bacterium]|jgi:release factor glutamine methyltransferase|nr:peptide chain release factor N(5)-glutamine methyltransferase [Gammaproteobacteria bacterium]